jgi:hypothetical protein
MRVSVRSALLHCSKGSRLQWRRLTERLEFLIANLPFLGVILLSLVRQPIARAITGVDKPTTLTVIDAHLEMLSMILLSTVWAIGYGWVEGTVNIGRLLEKANQSSFLSTYHIFLGITIVAISFSFGLLKGRRMLIHQKRYMFFTAFGNVTYSLVAQDFSYFFFVGPNDRLIAISWTCGGLGLGCNILRAPWDPSVAVAIPYWYFLALGFAGFMFFLGYRSVLVDLLVTRQIMKEAGYVEKMATPPIKRPTKSTVEEKPPTLPSASCVPKELKEQQTQAPMSQEIKPETKREQQVADIIDADRDELVHRLRERLQRQGA